MDHERPRQRVPRTLRERLYQRSQGTCERDGCNTGIDVGTFHVSHLRAHAHGGALTEENLEAWCSRCNLTQGVRDVRDTRIVPREWQLEALDRVVARIISDGAATVSAAPGAGKTVFAGLVFEALRQADVVDRMVVFVPRRGLTDQWAKALRSGRHLELKPRSELERSGQDGVIVTYQSLNADTTGIHRAQLERSRTLLVFDEVHHVGEPVEGRRPAWARRITELAGTVDQDLRVSGVLNLSGTLWRSKSSERISSVRYRAIDDGRLESLVDYEVSAERLIQAGELRPLDLYRLGARVELSDMAELQVIDSKMADLDEKPARAALAGLARSHEWRTAFVRAILDRLEQAHRSLDRHHVKALIVARRQDEARAFQQEVNQQMLERNLRPLAETATSDEPDAARVLEEFRLSTRVGVLCTVNMAGEGYDCPDIAVIGYATNTLTTLHVRQVIARAMRVTDVERRLQRIIPAAVVIPDVPVLVDTLVAYLAPFAHEVLVPKAATEQDEQDPEGDGQTAMLPLARYLVDHIRPTDETVTVSHNGNVDSFDGDTVRRLADALADLNVPPVYAPRVMAGVRRTVGDLLQARPFDPLPSDADALKTLSDTERYDSIEDRCGIFQRRLHGLEKWWSKQGESPIQFFAADANRVAGIPAKGRKSASLAQLERALEHERRVIAEYCTRTGTPRPQL